MTLVPHDVDRGGAHVGELRLRRMLAGELEPIACAEIDAHVATCGRCRTRLAALHDEQRGFTREIPFERFAGGVERAARVPRPRPIPRRAWVASLGSLAAAAVVLFVLHGSELGRRFVSPAPHERDIAAPTANHIKGSAALTEANLQLADAQGGRQRALAPGAFERLRPGARLRLGYRTRVPRYLAALAVDDNGEVTALYPDKGAALAVPPAGALTYLPGSVELVGRGQERVLLLLADRPFSMDEAASVTRGSLARAAGDVAHMPPPELDGRAVEAFTWLFEKP